MFSSASHVAIKHKVSNPVTFNDKTVKGGAAAEAGSIDYGDTEPSPWCSVVVQNTIAQFRKKVPHSTYETS